MAARLLHLLLCASVAALLVMPFCCNASRTTVSRVLLPSTSAPDDNIDVPTNDADQKVPTSATEKENEISQWARFQQVQEVAIDYTPPEANPDPGNPSPIGN